MGLPIWTPSKDHKETADATQARQRSTIRRQARERAADAIAAVRAQLPAQASAQQSTRIRSYYDDHYVDSVLMPTESHGIITSTGTARSTAAQLRLRREQSSLATADHDDVPLRWVMPSSAFTSTVIAQVPVAASAVNVNGLGDRERSWSPHDSSPPATSAPQIYGALLPRDIGVQATSSSNIGAESTICDEPETIPPTDHAELRSAPTSASREIEEQQNSRTDEIWSRVNTIMQRIVARLEPRNIGWHNEAGIREVVDKLEVVMRIFTELDDDTNARVEAQLEVTLRELRRDMAAVIQRRAELVTRAWGQRL